MGALSKGRNCMKKGEYKKAIDNYFLPALKQNVNDVPTLYEIGRCYFELGEFKTALTYFLKTLKLAGSVAEIHNSIGNCYCNLKMYPLAEKSFQEAFTLKPDYDANVTALGQVHYYLKNYTQSLEYYLQVKCKTDAVLYNTAFSYLASKQFEKGFELYETRLRDTRPTERVAIPVSQWDETINIGGRNNMLIVYEQGIGDNILYFRFVIELAIKYEDVGMKVFYFCKDVVSKLFHHPLVTIIDNVVTSEYDYMLYIMSLPHHLHLTDIQPNTIDYICRNESKRVWWKEQLADINPLHYFTIGIAHQGLLSNAFIEKVVELQQFVTLLELPVILISLQCNSTTSVEGIYQFMSLDKEQPFIDTIALLQNVDLVITVDTSIVHLAGVMGVPTWLLLGYNEWRWSNDPTTTYWYSNVELIRANPFRTVMEKVKDKLVKKLK